MKNILECNGGGGELLLVISAKAVDHVQLCIRFRISMWSIRSLQKIQVITGLLELRL